MNRVNAVHVTAVHFTFTEGRGLLANFTEQRYEWDYFFLTVFVYLNTPRNTPGFYQQHCKES